MHRKDLQVIVALGVFLSLWIASPGLGIGPPPILNAKLTDATGTYYRGHYYPENDDCLTNVYLQTAWDYYEDGCGPSIECPGCSSYGAFGSWYYQDCLLDPLGESASYQLNMDRAPLYFDEYHVSYGTNPPSPPDVKATLHPIEGLDALRYIPLEVSKTARLPVAAARYGIKIEVNGTHDPTTTAVGALFWITAVYDPSVFDVRVNCWNHLFYDPEAMYSLSTTEAYLDPEAVYSLSNTRAYFSTGVDTYWWQDLYYNTGFSWYVQDGVLPSGMPIMFHDESDLRFEMLSELRRGALPVTPDYVVIRLKDGHRLEDLGGRTVQLTLHTFSWAGDSNWCSPNGDAFNYSRTSLVQVGADLGEQTNDWSIQPADLKDECVPPSFSKTDDKSAEADIIGTRVIKDLNVELPSMRVGLNRCKVGRTLSATLANDAVYYPFGYYIDNPWGIPCYTAEFVALNVHGVWFAVDDVPGWNSWWIYDTMTGSDWLGVTDLDGQMTYCYWTGDNNDDQYITTWDYVYCPAKLREVDTPDLTQSLRIYAYADDDITLPLLYQQDPSGNNYIQYLYDIVNNGNGNELHLTLSGNGQRTLSATFGAWPTIPNDPGSCPLLACTNGSAGSWRQYEWYPANTPPGPYDGKLKSVKGAVGNVLAGFVYDDMGRLTMRTRGSTSQPVAEYIYRAPASQPQPDEPLPNTTMDARFYVNDTGDEGPYQLVRRTFNPNGQVIQMEEFQELQEGESENGTTSVTTFDFSDPPEDVSAEDLFYQLSYESYSYVGRCQIKTLPANHAGQRIAEYTQYDANAGWNVLQTFLAPPPSVVGGTKVEPAESDRCNWMSYGSYWQTGGVWLKHEQTDKSRRDSLAPDGAFTSYGYDTYGYPVSQDDPQVTDVAGDAPLVFQTWEYTPVPGGGGTVDHRKLKTHRLIDPFDFGITTSYQYDAFDNMTQKAQGWMSDPMDFLSEPIIGLTWDYSYNVFGQKEKEVDPDHYVHWTEFHPTTGLLTGTCISADKDAASPSTGNVVQQTQYAYADGMLSTIRVADNPGPFPKDSPSAWIETTLAYDSYGRLTGKTLGGFTTQYEYDRQDRLAKVTWPDGRSKQITRDGRGQITQIQYGKDGTTLTSAYTYDGAGNLIRRTTQGCPEHGKKTEYEYDRYNRRVKEIRREVTQ